jgi:membrane protein DedA with SNARE-associated domain
MAFSITTAWPPCSSCEEVGIWLPLPGDLLIVYFGYKVAGSPHALLSAIPMPLTVVVAACSGSAALYLIVRRFRWLIADRLLPVFAPDREAARGFRVRSF